MCVPLAVNLLVLVPRAMACACRLLSCLASLAWPPLCLLLSAYCEAKSAPLTDCMGRWHPSS